MTLSRSAGLRTFPSVQFQRQRRIVSSNSVSTRPLREGSCSRATWRRRALEVDWSDPEVYVTAAAALIGVAVGIGIPVFLIGRDRVDDERIQEIRDLNKTTFEATGEYLTRDEIAKIRPPRWMDKREFKDDD